MKEWLKVFMRQVDVILHLHIFTRLQKTDVAITVFR